MISLISSVLIFSENKKIYVWRIPGEQSHWFIAWAEWAELVHWLFPHLWAEGHISTISKKARRSSCMKKQSACIIFDLIQYWIFQLEKLKEENIANSFLTLNISPKSYFNGIKQCRKLQMEKWIHKKSCLPPEESHCCFYGWRNTSESTLSSFSS